MRDQGASEPGGGGRGVVKGLAAAFLLLLATGLPAAPRGSTLVVEIAGANKTTGTIKVALYDKEELFQRSMIFGLRLPAAEASRRATFEGLRPGRYAVSVYHDLDGDDALDRYITGYPSEPFGFSRNPRVVWGPPKWDECVFEIKPKVKTTTIRITLQD